MRSGWGAGAILMCLLLTSGFGAVSIDPLWMYKDLPDSERTYNSLIVRDTARGNYEFDQRYPTDTGDAYDGNYINWNYQFSTDSLIIKDKYDPTTVLYRDYRPGYAGFKIDWDNGVTGFPLARYKYLIITHKGPLPGHKVTIRFGYNSGCGTPTTFETIGSFTASSAWKTDSVKIPDEIRKIPESEVQNRCYYEMQVLINNADPNGSPTSGPGVFKVDNIALAGKSTANVGETGDSKKCGCGSGTGLALLPVIWCKAMAHRRRRKQTKN
jgi:hypothetical protein